ncbi:MAG TPA: hypothetical protein HPP76_12055 [Desulfuromonadales bacterium]|nr:hypothetical protein [Desulfuromonadales bacterium]
MAVRHELDIIEDALEDGMKISKVLQGAVREALLHHKQLGHQIVVMKDCRVVWLEPEDIQV